MTSKTKNSDFLRIRAERWFDGAKWRPATDIIIDGQKIVEIEKPAKSMPEISGHVTPAFIDAHSHIGMFREGEPGSEQEGNEYLQQILPLSDPLNAVYFDDRAFQDAVDFGVLYSCIMPGSGNLFGGKTRVIKNFAQSRQTANLLDYGYKMALGYNPRSTQNWKGDRPNTRMGIYGLLEKRFDEVLLKRKKAQLKLNRSTLEIDAQKDKTNEQISQLKSFAQNEYNLEFTKEDIALLEVLDGHKIVKVHVHKEDDVYYLLELVKHYGLQVTAEHTGDVFHQKVFEDLAQAQIPIVYGPLGSLGYKVELLHSYYQNVKLLMQSGAFFGLMTDHPVILSTALRDSLKYFLIFGMPEEQALALITSVNAKILKLDQQLGKIAVGATASLLVWNKDPLHLAAMPKVVIGEGAVLRKSTF